MMSLRTWNHERDELIRQHYSDPRARAWLCGVLGVSQEAVRKRASRIGVSHSRNWSTADDLFLESNWSRMSIDKLCARLGRSHDAVYSRVARLRLERGLPDGWITIEAGEKITGFSRTGLLTLVREAKVEKRMAPMRYVRQTRQRRWMVREDDLRRAVQWWSRTETTEAAARSRGIHGFTLRSWLRDDGLLRGQTKRRRFEPDVIDRVIEQHQSPARGHRRAGSAA